MYSHEVDEFIRTRNGVLTRDEYMEITPYNCPQITRVYYDTFNNMFHIYTNDGYEWEFIVRNND